VDLPINQFKRALKAGHRQIGFWSSLSSPLSAEIVGGAGFDWVLIDAEHGPSDVPRVLPQLHALQGTPAHPIVRPPWNDAVVIKRFLDIGVQSFLVPYVQTAEEAGRAVAATRYPPRGVRGFAVATRASRFGRIADYHARAEAEICVLVQVETRAALDNLEAIAAVDGVDGVFIGPGDLSADLGYLAQAGHPEVQRVIEDAVGRINKTGAPAGILTPDEPLARHYLDLGCLFVAVGSDAGLLARGTEQIAGRFKENLRA
jgi:4-hydroxy-2-oxoheptanedioate aldolase